MARNARLWQNPLAHIKQFDGDPAECNKWYGWAQQKLGFMLKTNPGPNSQVFHPTPDVTIRVDTRPNRISIQAGVSFYLESGFIDLRSIAVCNQYTYIPSWLYYSNRVQTYMDSIPYPLQGFASLSADTPYFLGQDLPERETKVTTCDSNERVESLSLCGVDYSNPAAIYCNTDKIRQLKSLQAKIPPSVFSGKLRLLVQALYGTPKRYDYTTIENYPLSCPPLYLGNLQLGYELKVHLVSTGLYTTANLDYYLISITGSAVTATKLDFKGPAENFRKHLLAKRAGMSNDNIKRAEAYILSRCVVGTTQSVSVDLSSLQGEPIAYGWHFNWSGSEASIILHSDNLPTDQYWYAREYKLNFSVSNGIVQASLSQVGSQSKWTAVGNKIVFSPEYFTGNMSAFVNPMKSPFPGWTSEIDSNYEANIYCYYKNDILVRTKLSNVFIPASSTAAGYNYFCGVINGIQMRYSSGVNTPKSYTSSVSLNGITISSNTTTQFNTTQYEYFDGKGLTGYISPYPIGDGGTGSLRMLTTDTNIISVCGVVSYRDKADQLGLPPYLVDSLTTETITDPTTGNPTGVHLTYNNDVNIVDMYSVSGASESMTAIHVVTIPFYDCESCFISEKYTRSYSETSRSQVYANGRTSANTVFVKWYLRSDGQKIVISTSGPYATTATRIYNQSAGAGSLPVQNSYTGTVKFYDDSGLVFEDQFSGYDNLGNYSTYFDVDYVTNPIGYFAADAKSSIMGDSTFKITGLVEQTDGYIHDVSVGWA